jgi:hypothetical protein
VFRVEKSPSGFIAEVDSLSIHPPTHPGSRNGYSGERDEWAQKRMGLI